MSRRLSSRQLDYLGKLLVRPLCPLLVMEAQPSHTVLLYRLDPRIVLPRFDFCAPDLVVEMVRFQGRERFLVR